MLAIKYLLMVAGVLLLAAGAAIAIYDAWRVFQHSRWLLRGTGEDVVPELIDTPQPVRWRISVALAVVACLPLLIAMSIVVVPLLLIIRPAKGAGAGDAAHAVMD